ncbi:MULTISPECIES: phosphodiester glycosidase family protein [Xanthomonas]|uniref:Phosphodiester glycosidase family protein n=1 Tax=Xanthomonas dyei TaxID=743699 RepID=A0ABZ0DCF1_9XANT|nr:phosphodiester glycosidase family protein [Xanthomonas dyei]WOB26282.1 phosphodiester glycosidase family protein [Xanthomonas dyei]WOB53904.1 phosphodiester glycosidase family protein [Xanthomonas dyei]
MRSDRRFAAALGICLMAACIGNACADQAATPAATPPFVAMETIVSGDCWGQWPGDVLAAVTRCKPAEHNRIALQVLDDADGPARVGSDAAPCSGARCIGLAQLLQSAPAQALLLRTPPARIDAVLAALDRAQARARVTIEPLVQPVPAPAAPVTLAPGVRYWRKRVDGPQPVMLHIAQIDLTTPGLQMVGTHGDRSGGGEFLANPTTAFVRDNGLALAINADYFLPFDGGHLFDKAFVPAAGQGVTAEGLAIDDGHLDSAAATSDARVDAAFCVSARNAVRIVRGSCPSGTRVGVGAGPLLLLDGKRQPREATQADYYNGPEPRSALGLDRAGNTLWMVVVDGRQPGYSAGMTLDALTAVLQQLGAYAAINLDGGGSSTLAARVDGRVRTLNRPIHTGIPGRERPVANQLGVRIVGQP